MTESRRAADVDRAGPDGWRAARTRRSIRIGADIAGAEREVSERRRELGIRYLTVIWKERETGLDPATFSVEE